MPVRGAPVRPSKKATFHPCSPQYMRKASLLAASAARALMKALMRLFVTTALSAAKQRFRVRAAFCPNDKSSGMTEKQNTFASSAAARARFVI
ncbi:MAG: hypothetical protein M3Z23_07020 [Acidobacteriota bacterium]|nr:hypothetical protein [Acidobacteriota bacterium]